MKITMNNAFRIYDKKRAQKSKLKKAWKQATDVCNAKTSEMQTAANAVRQAERTAQKAYDLVCRKRNLARWAFRNAEKSCQRTRQAIRVLFPQEYRAWRKMTKGIKIPK